MRLLVVTQVVDESDSALGFFHRWIEEFANVCETVTVICLKEGNHSLPDNVRVLSLGKEKGGRSTVSYALNFLGLAWKLRHDYDAAFVHMNPEYVALAGPLWKLLRKPVYLWYTHKSVTAALRVACVWANGIFTASSRSLRARTSKKRVVGHGIDDSLITLAKPPESDTPLRLLTVGRVAPVKRLEILIDALALLDEEGIDVQFTIVGRYENEYLETLKERASRAGIEERVHFRGPVPHRDVRRFLEESHLFLHASDTGSLDKASLEPLAVGMPVITVDTELASENIPAIIQADADPASFAERIRSAIGSRLWNDQAVRTGAYEYVRERHSLSGLIPRLLAEPAKRLHRRVMETTKDHFNTVAKGAEYSSYEERRWAADAKVLVQREATQRFIERHVLPLAKGAARITELGPGPGTWTRFLANASPDASFMLTDISSEMLARARAALPEGADVTTIESDFTEVSLPNASADLFFSSRALEYVVPKDAAISILRAHIRQGGRGAVITKMPKPILNRISGRKPSPLHRNQIGPADAKRLLREAGFVDIRAYPVTFSMPLMRSAAADRLLMRLFALRPLNPLSAFFAESYALLFRAP